MAKLKLPKATREGSIAVTWPESEAAKVDTGTLEGRVLKILTPRKIIVKFIYERDLDSPDEQIGRECRPRNTGDALPIQFNLTADLSCHSLFACGEAADHTFRVAHNRELSETYRT